MSAVFRFSNRAAALAAGSGKQTRGTPLNWRHCTPWRAPAQGCTVVTKINVALKVRWQMANDIAGMIHADLASLTNAANDLAQNAAQIAPAAQFGATLPGSSAGSFAQAMQNAVSGVNAADQAASAKMADVDAGRSDDLVGAMMASQEASLSFSMLMQVRNKVMGAVDELIKLPL